MRMLRLTLWSLLPTLIVVAACAPRHIRPYTPRERNYEAGDYQSAPAAVSGGSLWQDSSRGLFADFRATRVGDLVTVRIDETADASGNASTKLSHQADLFGFMSALVRSQPDIDPSQLLSLMSDSSMDGSGRTKRLSRARGVIAVRVKQQLPNHDLFVEGSKVILVNDEELHIYISGVIRPEDIEQDNSVRSSLVADAQIEFSGRGSVTDAQDQGWLGRVLSKVRPF